MLNRWTLMGMLLTTLGCGGGSTGPEPIVDGWAVARATLTENETYCYHQKLAYCIRDPAFVDPILQEVLDRQTDGVMPNTERRARRIAKQCVGPYRSRQYATPESRGKIEAAIAAYYANPTVTVDKDTVRVDLGILPGVLEAIFRDWMVLNPPLFVDGELDSKETARLLKKYSEAHPTAKTIVLEVDMPAGGGSFTGHEYIWQAEPKRVVVHLGPRPREAWFTGAITDWGPFLDGSQSLRTEGLTYCSFKNQAMDGTSHCPF